MEEQNKKPQHEERDAAVRACSDALVETMKQAGFTEQILLGARRADGSGTYDVLIQWKRATWSKPVTGFPWDLHPEANINGLYWRLTGIGKQQIEGLDR